MLQHHLTIIVLHSLRQQDIIVDAIEPKCDEQDENNQNEGNNRLDSPVD